MVRYSKAPITEAIVDVRAALPPSVGLADIDALGREELLDYPERQNRLLIEATMQGGNEVGAHAKQTHIGYVYKAAADPYVAQYRVDGFTLSRLAPYADWPSFQAEAERLWGFYERAFQPVSVTRLAVRYINRLDVPALHFELEDYLCAFPQVPEGIPHSIAGFVVHLKIPQPDIGATLLLNVATAEPPSPDVTSILLDIDVFLGVDYRDNLDRIWEDLNKLHERKNVVFEACITDQTRRLIA